MAGDFAGALDDLEWERARQSNDGPDAEYLQREIDDVRRRLAANELLTTIEALPDDDARRLARAKTPSE